ncbi:MAG: hypothetical protein R6V77_01300, partial [Candidatus Cloacimonadaceae bacterium]
TYVNVSTTAIASQCNLDLYFNLAAPPILNQFGQIVHGFYSIPPGIPQQYVFSVNNSVGWAGTWNSYIQIDADGWVTESNETNNVFGPFNITWTAVALPAIDDLSIERITGTSNVRLDWTYPVTVTRFKVYRSTLPYFTPDAGTFLTNVTYPTTEYIDTAAGDKFFYVVTAEQDPAAAPVAAPPRQSVIPSRRNE